VVPGRASYGEAGVEQVAPRPGRQRGAGPVIGMIATALGAEDGGRAASGTRRMAAPRGDDCGARPC
jgi:hypothetical protein